MSKEGNDDKRYQHAEQLGRTNKTLIASVKGWCQHIDVKGRHASMMGQMLDIPMSTSIGCPYTEGGYQAANLEWIARDFIIENCLTCPKHKPINADNFGVKVVADYVAYKSKLEAEENAKRDRLSALRAEAELLIQKERTKAEVKKLSILRLAEKLGGKDEENETATQLLESARLSPEFFSGAAIDYISLFFDNKNFGALLMETVFVLQKSSHQLSAFASNNILEAIENENSSDLAAAIWADEISNPQLSQYPDILNKIVQNCSYQNFYHFGTDKAGSYPETMKILNRLYLSDTTFFNSMVQALLSNRIKTTRVNTNGMLRDLLKDHTVNLINHLPLLIHSFDFEDDTDGGESADHETLKTIIELYLIFPREVMGIAEKEGVKLSEWGQAELLKFYQRVLTEDDLYDIDEKMSQEAVSRLNFLLMNDVNKHKLTEEALEAIEQVAQQRPEALNTHFDAYIGYLIQINEKRRKFEWYRKDAGDPSKPAATFNPLFGKNFWELENEATNLARLFHSSGNIVSKLIAFQPEDRTESFAEVIEKIDSKIDGKFKGQLIGVLESSVKDVVSLSNIIPRIYNYLHDIDSEDVRVAGMRFIVHLISEHPQLITSTLIELIKVFLEDQVVGVKGLAIEAYGEIIKQFPEQADKEYFKRIENLIFDKYVFVHKAAVSFSYKVYPFLTKSEKALWNSNLYNLADFYFKSDDFKYGLEITRAVLYFAAEVPVVHGNVVKRLLVRFCNCKDYYVEKNALKLLGYLARKNPNYFDEWVKEAISFLAKTIPQEPLGMNDDRHEILDFFYNLNEAAIVRHKDLIITHVKFSIDNLKNPIMPDVINFYGIFAYFNRWLYVKELAEYFDGKIPHNSKFESVHKFNLQSKRMAETEMKVSTQSIDLTYIYSLSDVQS